ncbi:MAG: peptidase U35 [Acidobacteria bacterium]|nr:peptidase U35 [Acidobacteriota bacterium]
MRTTEVLTRGATFEPSTFNAESNTVSVVFSTGAETTRWDGQGQFIERLDMTPAAVDLTRLNGGPVLANHDRFSVDSVLGIVETSTVDGTRGTATVRFGQRPEIQGIVTDIRGGIIRSVSVGYTVQQWKESKRPDGVRVKDAIRWTPVEISFTPIGADPAAKTRSIGESMHETQIRELATAVGVQAAFADDLIQRNISLDDARTAIIREAAGRLPTINNRQPATVTRDSRDGLIERMADGLLARINPLHKPDAGKEFATHRIGELALRYCRETGLSTLGSRAELITRAMQTTSDFPYILAEVFNKGLLVLRTSPTPILQVFKRATVDDFRKRHVLELSDGSGLSKVAESGEIKWGTIKDAELASYGIASYAKGYTISFQTLVNDDMGVLADLSMRITRGARTWFAGFLVDTIIANPKLADNKAVFHADHGNLAGTGNAPGEGQLSEAKLAMRLQTDLSGNPIDARPVYILIPAALETGVDKLMAQLYPQQSSDAEVSARNLTSVVDPRFDAKGQNKAWYLFADPATAPVFEYAELSGYEGPRVETQPGFNTLGTEMRVVWHVGAGAIDHRGAYKNAGV